MNGKDPLIALAVYSQISNNAASKTIKNKLHIALVVQLPTRCWDQPWSCCSSSMFMREHKVQDKFWWWRIYEIPTRGYSFTQRLLPKYFLVKIDAVMPAKSRNFWINLKLKEDWNFYAFSCLKCRWSIFFSILKYFQRSPPYFLNLKWFYHSPDVVIHCHSVQLLRTGNRAMDLILKSRFLGIDSSQRTEAFIIFLFKVYGALCRCH